MRNDLEGKFRVCRITNIARRRDGGCLTPVEVRLFHDGLRLLPIAARYPRFYFQERFPGMWADSVSRCLTHHPGNTALSQEGFSVTFLGKRSIRSAGAVDQESQKDFLSMSGDKVSRIVRNSENHGKGLAILVVTPKQDLLLSCPGKRHREI